MIKNKKQMFLVISIFALLLFLGGTTYAWFTYSSTTSEQKLISGDIYLVLNEGQEEISSTNVFPETVEEARARNNNYITFNIEGINETGKTIYYEIDLNRGTDKASPKVRYNDADLRFDLVELDSNGDEQTYLLSNVGYDTLVNKRIYVDEIPANSSTEVIKRYKLRMWLSDDVIISDTAENATYPATGYSNYYGNIKVSVIGDFTDKYFGYQKVKKAITAKINAETNSCNPIWVDDNGTASDTSDDITYFSGTNACVDMNYVWYSGKLWRITAIYPDGAMKLITQNAMTTLAFNASGQVNFYTDANTKSYMYQWLNEDFYDTLYSANTIIDNTKEWNIGTTSTISSKPSESVNISANVGLLNSYEYYNSYRRTGNYSNNYLSLGDYWWLLNPYSESKVWRVASGGAGTDSTSVGVYVIRPSIYLKSELGFIGGGTSDNPYKIVGDKNVGQANELINTRLSGEYVKLVRNENEQLFRIIGVEDNKTKIIAMDYAENNNTRNFATSKGSANTLWGSGTTTETDTWYTYLNAEDTGYFDTLKDTYGDLFDSGIYQLGTSSYNYKNSICPDPVPKEENECAKEFNIGLPRYGEMFAAAATSDSVQMWLMNRYSLTSVWYIGQGGDGHGTSPNNAYGARPTVHLKSTVKILSGSGTESDPYVVGL